MDSHNIIVPEECLMGCDLNQILSRLMNANKVSLTALHRNTGVAIPTLKRLQSDPTCNPTIATLLPVANFFGITLNQLIGKEKILSDKIEFIEKKASWLEVPIIQWSKIMDWCDHKIITSEINISTDAEVGANPYALIINHDDWITSGFLKDSVLIIDSELKATHKDYVIVCKAAQDLPTLKQIIIDEDRICFKSLNPYFSATPFDENHRVLGVVIQIKNTFKN